MAATQHPNEFRHLQIIRTEGVWKLVSSSSEDGLKVWVTGDETGEVIWRKTGPVKLIRHQYPPLLFQADKLGIGLPELKHGELLVPDYGFGFLFRRRTMGWQDTMKDILAFERTLLELYPNVCILDVALRNMTILSDGRAACPDMRTFIEHPGAMKQWPSIEVYRQYVRQQLQESWNEFMAEYGDEIDYRQEQLEKAGASDPNEIPEFEIPWES